MFRRFLLISTLAAFLLVQGAAHAATVTELKNIVKDLDALDAQLQADPFDTARTAQEIGQELSAELFVVPSATLQEEIGDTAELLRMRERLGNVVIVQIGATVLFFRDVPANVWFAPYVRDLAEQGIVNGYKDAAGQPLGEYRPALSVSIEEVAKVAVTVSGDAFTCPAQAKNLSASGSWSLPYIGCAELRGWGVYSDGTVDVKRPALRSEVVFTLLQAFNTQGVAMTGSGWTTGFSDVPTSSPFAIAIARARDDGIISGHTDEEGMPLGTFGPDEPVNRAEFAKMVSLAMQVYGMQ